MGNWSIINQTNFRMVEDSTLYHPKFKLALKDLSRFELITQTSFVSNSTYKYIIYIYIFILRYGLSV